MQAVHVSFAQSDTSLVQKVNLNKGSTITLNNKTIRAYSDTTLLLQKGQEYTIGTPPKITENFYDSLETAAQKNKITSELYKLLITTDDTAFKKKPGVKLTSSESRFDAYKGKIIRNIAFKQLKVFGQNLADTSDHLNKAESIIDHLHMNTRQFVLRNNLIIKSGDPIKPLQIAENERIMRESPYLEQASFYVLPVENTDSVDVLIITRDVFSLGVDFYLDGLADFDFTLFDDNFMGLGHRFSTTINAETERAPYINMKQLAYTMTNIRGSFIDGVVSFDNVNNKRSIGADFYRDFFTTYTRYAGGLQLSYHDDDEIIYEPLVRTEKLTYSSMNIWGGRAFKTDLLPPSAGFSITGGIAYTKYFKRPEDEETRKNFKNSTQYLAELTLFRSRYYTGRYYRRFGIVEDIPYGYKFTLTMGPDNFGSNIRFYTATDATVAHKYSFGYMLNRLSLSGYWYNNVFQQGMIKYGMEYYSNSHNYNNSVMRHFAKLDYTIGLHRLSNEYINIVDEMDITGVKSTDTILFAGTQRFYLEMGAINYTPIDFYGFRLAWFASGGLAFIGSNDRPFWQNDDFLKVSAGILFRNEHLVIKTLQIKCSYLPLLPGDYNNLQIQIGGISVLKFNELRPKPPSTIPFR